ncbi:hypothetical protein IHE45_08G155800 [Dioscorea alata]|uniref:Uncharacterized protein n=1 Tax=Dioscorea alata TaxID=55571 RepID=A0ACB7VNU6_DIOAL|nr:hypothetical protein IHE45_08G155800 [Dioscorea alata]
MQRWKFLFACFFIPIAYVVAGVLAIIADKPLHEAGHSCPPDSPGKAYKLGTASLCLMGAALAITNGMFKRPRIRSKSDSARPSTSMKVAWMTFLLFCSIDRRSNFHRLPKVKNLFSLGSTSPKHRWSSLLH